MGRICGLWRDAAGGLEPDETERARYLSTLFDRVYVADVVERYGVQDIYVENLIDVVSSSIGSLTNPSKLANTLNSVNHAGPPIRLSKSIWTRWRTPLSSKRRGGMTSREKHTWILPSNIMPPMWDSVTQGWDFAKSRKLT